GGSHARQDDGWRREGYCPVAWHLGPRVPQGGPAMTSPTLPGRLGSPAMTLRTDPRADPRMIAAMEPYGLADLPAEMPVDASSPLEQLLDYVAAAEEGFELLFNTLVGGLPPVDGVTRRTEIIRGSDGNDVTLYIHAPAHG